MRTLSLTALLIFLLAAPAALALPVVHGNFAGTNVQFQQVTETTQTAGDDECLFTAPDGNPANNACAGTPLAFGDSLLFFPTVFSATATGAGGADTTHSLLSMFVAANPLTTIDQLKIDEFGDVLLTGVGNPVTSASVSMSGFVTVIQTTTGPCLLGPGCTIGFTGTLNPAGTYSLPGDGGPPAILWSGGVLVDIASQVPDATWVQLQFDNILNAASESGTSATIQKKVVSGPAIAVTIIPEPATGSLLGLGLLGLLLLKRPGTR